MAITTTTNKSLIKVTVGTEAGTWGPYINTDQDLLDNMLGGTATIALTNAPVTLSSAQYQCAFLRFTGAITADIAITFPSVGSFYTIINDTTNSSNFNLTAKTTAAGGRVIGIAPGNMTDILTDGVNVRFRGLPPVGAYWDHAGSSVPRWVSACTIPPYLNCDGTTFSSANYPSLYAVFNGSNVLPDLRGRARAYLNQGTGRMTSSVGTIDGDTLFAGGGFDGGSFSILQANLPSYALPVTDPGHFHIETTVSGAGAFTRSPVNNSGSAAVAGGTTQTLTATTGVTVDSGGSGTAIPVVLMQPTTVGGITMVRGG